MRQACGYLCLAALFAILFLYAVDNFPYTAQPTPQEEFDPPAARPYPLPADATAVELPNGRTMYVTKGVTP